MTSEFETMSSSSVEVSEPFVSIVTPVYNGESYLTECITSVLAQTYQNWEYVIVDSCSTDRSRDIAEAYAAGDDRIRVCVHRENQGVMSNWNYAMRQISVDSHYCKVVHADDWLFPDCISSMVAVAQESDSIGLVSAYRLNENYVDLDGLPYPSAKTSGLEIGCLCLSRNPLWLFGSPTSVLYKADLVRSRDRFYDEALIHADTEVCFNLLQNWDFGFVHQLLSFTRRHNESVSSAIEEYGTRRVEGLLILRRYGPVFLNEREYAQRFGEKLKHYHAFLVRKLFEPRPADFWHYHRRKTRELDIPLRWASFIKPFIREILCRLMPISCKKNR